MPTHWTYDNVDADADLAQGDIIEPTAAIRAILQEVHPHFLDSKYVGFMILSQSCDLVQRAGYRGQPINLCVIRELASIADRLLHRFCGSEMPGVYCSDDRGEGKKFLQRVINQNEQAVGLFYLHPDLDAGISTPCIAMLRIAIALHAKHYVKIREARRGRLRSEFQAKLGWLVGNLYARVGTTDWSESAARKKDQRIIVDQTIDGLTGIVWASAAAIATAKERGISSDGKTAEELRVEMKGFEPAPPNEQLLAQLARVVAADDLAIPPEVQKRLLNRLRNDVDFGSAVKRIQKIRQDSESE